MTNGLKSIEMRTEEYQWFSIKLAMKSSEYHSTKRYQLTFIHNRINDFWWFFIRWFVHFFHSSNRLDFRFFLYSYASALNEGNAMLLYSISHCLHFERIINTNAHRLFCVDVLNVYTFNIIQSKARSKWRAKKKSLSSIHWIRLDVVVVGCASEWVNELFRNGDISL